MVTILIRIYDEQQCQKKSIGSTTRPIFVPDSQSIGVKEINISFDWHMGMTKIVRQRSIDSLHENAKKQGFERILEASSKSKQSIGIQLSAFFLKNENRIPVENLFQSSKVFEKGGPFLDLLRKMPRDAKRDERLRSHGKMIRFTYENRDFPLDPKSLFYDWLYIKTLFDCQNNYDLKEEFIDRNFQAFSDIEFNPTKSFSCQARTLALTMSLYQNESIKDFIYDPVKFSQEFNLYPSPLGETEQLF